MGIKDEAYNVIPPLQNTDGIKAVAKFGAAPTCNPTLYRYLPSYFGGFDKGGYYTLKMDSPDDSTAKCHWVLAPDQSGTIDPRAVGNGTDICWPMVDGDVEHFRVPPVHQKRSNVVDSNGHVVGQATTGATCLPTILQYRWLKMVASASCMLVVRRSSLPEAGNAGVFKAPDNAQ